MSLPLLTDEELELVIRTLPSAPRILAQLAHRLQALDTDVSDVTRIVRRDSGLTARLIDMANSAAYVGFEPATSTEEAVARLGFRETYRTIGWVASTQLTDEPLSYYGVSPRRLRENSLFCALMMEEMMDSAQMDHGSSYTLGLLRSIGKVVLDRLARHRPGLNRFDPECGSVVTWERATWGVGNTDIAARVFELWEFPSESVDAIRYHCSPEPSAPRPAKLLNVAAGAAEAHGFGLPGEHWHYAPEALGDVGIEEGHAIWAAERACSILNNVSPAFA